MADTIVEGARALWEHDQGYDAPTFPTGDYYVDDPYLCRADDVLSAVSVAPNRVLATALTGLARRQGQFSHGLVALAEIIRSGAATDQQYRTAAAILR